MTAAASTATRWSEGASAAGLAHRRAGRQADRGAKASALIFSPGLSTADEVTAISGRGVGMDVVRANIERIGGVVDFDSAARPGRQARHPRAAHAHRSSRRSTVSVDGQRFAVPRSAIDEIFRVGGGAVKIDQVGEAEVATVRGRRVPLIGLARLLGVESRVARDEQRSSC